VRDHAFRGRRTHGGNTPGASEAADVTQVRLQDVHRVHADHASPLGQVVVLLAAGDVHRKGRRDFGRPLQFPIRTRLFEPEVTVVFHAATDLDRFGRRVTTVAVGQQFDVVPDGLADRRDQRLGPPGRSVPIVPRGDAEPHLEGPEAAFIPQASQPRSFVGGRDVAFHAGPVHRERDRLAADQLANRFALELAIRPW